MKKKQLHITVTELAIRKGVKGDPCNCPVAKALRRASKERIVSAGMGVMFIGPKNRRITWVTPYDVRNFIEIFDAGKPVVPFNFDMPLTSTYPKIELPN